MGSYFHRSHATWLKLKGLVGMQKNETELSVCLRMDKDFRLLTDWESIAPLHAEGLAKDVATWLLSSKKEIVWHEDVDNIIKSTGRPYIEVLKVVTELGEICLKLANGDVILNPYRRSEFRGTTRSEELLDMMEHGWVIGTFEPKNPLGVRRAPMRAMYF